MTLDWMRDVNAGLERAKQENRLALLDYSAAPE